MYAQCRTILILMRVKHRGTHTSGIVIKKNTIFMHIAHQASLSPRMLKRPTIEQLLTQIDPQMSAKLVVKTMKKNRP